MASSYLLQDSCAGVLLVCGHAEKWLQQIMKINLCWVQIVMKTCYRHSIPQFTCTKNSVMVLAHRALLLVATEFWISMRSIFFSAIKYIVSRLAGSPTTSFKKLASRVLTQVSYPNPDYTNKQVWQAVIKFESINELSEWRVPMTVTSSNTLNRA